MTVAGIARLAPGRPGVAPASAVPSSGNAIAFWGFMCFTFVLFIGPTYFFPSLEALRLGKVSMGLAVGAYALNRLVRRRPLTLTTPEVRLVVWFTLLAMISIPLALSPRGSLEFFFDVLMKSVMAFFLIANLLQTMGRLKMLIVFIVLSGLIYSATALHHFAIGYTMVSRGEPDRIWGYPSPLAGNPDGLGLILNVILSLAVGLYLASGRRLVKALLAVGMALMVGGIIASFSRGAFLALAATLAVFLAKLVRARGALVLLPALALAALGMLLAPDGYTTRLYSLADPTLDRVGSVSQRWRELTTASWFLLENPVIGGGVGMDLEVEPGQRWAIHNIFLQVGVELGLAGVLLYGLLVFQVLRGLRRMQKRLGPVPQARELVAFATGLELAVYGYLVGAFFLPVAYEFTFFYLAGLTVAIRAVGARQTAAPPPRAW